MTWCFKWKSSELSDINGSMPMNWARWRVGVREIAAGVNPATPVYRVKPRSKLDWWWLIIIPMLGYNWNFRSNSWEKLLLLTISDLTRQQGLHSNNSWAFVSKITPPMIHPTEETSNYWVFTVRSLAPPSHSGLQSKLTPLQNALFFAFDTLQNKINQDFRLGASYSMFQE